jgi:stage V sporulation protein S
VEIALPGGAAAAIEKWQIIQVSATSSVKGVAGQVAGLMRDHDVAQVQALGAVAVNRTIKALAIARESLRTENIGIACTPHFIDLEDQYQTGVCFTVKPCRRIIQQAALSG